jgi:hypothetical protein
MSGGVTSRTCLHARKPYAGLSNWGSRSRSRSGETGSRITASAGQAWDMRRALACSAGCAQDFRLSASQSPKPLRPLQGRAHREGGLIGKLLPSARQIQISLVHIQSRALSTRSSASFAYILHVIARVSRLREIARELECDESRKAFDKALGKFARTKPKPEKAILRS